MEVFFTTFTDSATEKEREKTKTKSEPKTDAAEPRPADIAASEKWRQEGNVHYKKAFAQGLAPTLKKSRIQEALNCYNKAIVEASGDSESMASATKNYAKAAWLLASVIQDLDEDLRVVSFYYKDAISHFSKAVLAGNRAKDLTWIQNLLTSYRSCLDDAFKACSSSTFRNRLSCIESYCQSMLDDIYCGDCYQEMATVLFHHAVIALESGDFKTSLWALKECYRPIEEMKRCGCDRPDLGEEANIMEMDINLQTASAESYQAIMTGRNYGS